MKTTAPATECPDCETVPLAEFRNYGPTWWECGCHGCADLDFPFGGGPTKESAVDSWNWQVLDMMEERAS